MSYKLSEGAISALMRGEQVANPIMQILGTKKLATPSGDKGDRIRLMVSDGRHSHTFAMLATQLNERVESGELSMNAVMRIDKYICNSVGTDRRVMIILEVTILDKTSGKIGNPIPYTAAGSSATTSSSSSSSSIFEVKSEPKTDNSKQFPKPQANYYDQTKMMTTSTNQFESRTIPVMNLTPYQNKWVIKVRVASKSAIRTWSNSRGEGKLFSVTFLDESGEIRATGFNDQCDKFFNLLEEGKVFYVSNATIKMANKNFSNVENEYEITFHKDTVIEPANGECFDIPQVKFSFVAIDELPQKPKDSLVDVIGVCKSYGDIQSITSKATNKQLKKRELHLVDQSNKEINLTIWGNDAEQFDGDINSVIAVKGARVSDFGGCSLSLINSSLLQKNPSLPEAYTLKGWYDSMGSRMQSQSLSVRGGSFSGGSDEWKFLGGIQTDVQEAGDKPMYYMCMGRILIIRKENYIYRACASPSCNKKVLDLGGTYRCEKCNVETTDFKWRLLLSFFLADFCGGMWVTCFNEAAEMILGQTADQIGLLNSSQEDDKAQAIITAATFKEFIFKLNTKRETFNDETRTKTVVMSVTPLNHNDHIKKMLSDLSH